VEKVEAEVKLAREGEKKKEEERKGVQGELDDLLEVFGDLEEKVTKYKVSASLLVWWCCCVGTNSGCRNGSRRWVRRCLTERTRMKMGRMTRTRRKKMRSRVVPEVRLCGRPSSGLDWGVGFPGLQKQARHVYVVHFQRVHEYQDLDGRALNINSLNYDLAVLLGIQKAVERMGHIKL